MSADIKSSLGQSSFWNARKKRFAVIAVFVLIASTGGLYLKVRNTDQSNAMAAPVIPEEWVAQFFHTIDINTQEIGGVYGDPDNDKLNNYQEYELNTNPMTNDTDKDGRADGYEVAYGFNPLINESGNQIANPQQVINQTTEEFARAGVVDQQEVENVFHVNRPLVMPQIPDSQMNIVLDSDASKIEYLKQNRIALADYYNGQVTANFNGLFSTQSVAETAPFKAEVAGILKNLYGLPVPRSMVPSLKNDIVYFSSIATMIAMQEKYIQNPEDYSVWGEIIYQSRILALASGDIGTNE